MGFVVTLNLWSEFGSTVILTMIFNPFEHNVFLFHLFRSFFNLCLVFLSFFLVFWYILHSFFAKFIHNAILFDTYCK